MKTIAIWNRYAELSRDGYCFDHPNASIGDDLLKPYIRLKEIAEAWGIRVDTLDRVWAQASVGGIDAAVFFDYPAGRDAESIAHLHRAGVPCYLVTWENEIILPENFDPALHTQFEKVFTWHDGFTDHGGSKYVKIRVPQSFGSGGPEKKEEAGSNRRGFACMIASHKTGGPTPDPRELYTARIDTLQWFALRAPGQLDLYGPGWDGADLWKGVIPPGGKRAVMANYDFSICYENARNIPGYVTEKIFDSMMAGCIPIYWGAPNIHDYVPCKTYIDRLSFHTHEAMLRYLTALRMNPDAVNVHRNAIREFLGSSSLIQPWTIETFVDTLLKGIVGSVRSSP